MAREIIVSDTGPLISLEKLSDGYGWMQQFYSQILIPEAVAQELCQGMFSDWEAYRNYYNFGAFVSVVDVATAEIFPGYELLDIGERQAIQLAWQQQLPLLIEEERGRQVAKALGLRFSGLAGQILKAYREQIISSTVARLAWRSC
ncbi:hypothetical protein C7293_13400 [filamentous cyanobacterium CCT1]|nr:hypothetical protein C7293_13400 [filamentous cyanobacterium CCT1]PSN80320.1 hypothetical protein C8B47_07170 [filamentous cyanobacterium CCP4]